MYRGNGSRVFPIILVLVIIAIAIAALVSAGQAIFGGGQANQSQVDIGRDALLNTSADRSVRMTVRGPLVADENFRSYQVTVDSTSRTFTTYSGYLDQALKTQQYGNNVKAYEEFVYALDKANMMKGQELKDKNNDTRGICANGKVYQFEVLQNNSTVKQLWTSTCKGSSGSLKASVPQVEGLFTDQIPDKKAFRDTLKL